MASNKVADSNAKPTRACKRSRINLAINGAVVLVFCGVVLAILLMVL